jgi:hypothetical protein
MQALGAVSSPGKGGSHAPNPIHHEHDNPNSPHDSVYGSPTLLSRGSAELSYIETEDSLAQTQSPVNVFDRLYNQALQQQARAHGRVMEAEEQERNCIQPASPIKVRQLASPTSCEMTSCV